MLRVSLVKHADQVTVEAVGPYQLFDAQGHSLMQGEGIEPTEVKAQQGSVKLGTQIFSNAPLVLTSKGDGIKIDGRLYRDSVLLWPESKDKISVVNEVNLEEYLKGVLPWEVDPKWPLESLKAQAVASRTFALFRAIESADKKYDLTGDVYGQVYKGKSIEKPETNRAVDSTRGQILTYRGKIFPAYFHSTCGGATTSPDRVWHVKSHPALKGTVCRFCEGSKHYRWIGQWKASEIEAVLNRHGYKISGLKNIFAVDIDPSGRAGAFAVTYPGGQTKVPANQFRIWMDPSKFKSTLIESIEPAAGGFLFKGRGWGHGVGMCQYGMKKLGELGYTYRQILDYYFSGSDLTQYY